MARRAAECLEGMFGRGGQIQIQFRMSLEWLRRVLVRLVIDSQMTGRAAIDARDRFERLIVVQIAQNDLLDALGRIHEVENGRIAE